MTTIDGKFKKKGKKFAYKKERNTIPNDYTLFLYDEPRMQWKELEVRKNKKKKDVKEYENVREWAEEQAEFYLD